MEIPVSCQCGKSFKAKSSLAGKTVACPGCKSPITIPAATPPAPTVPQPPAPPTPAPAPAPAPAPTPAGPEIVLACGCGQQFKVDAQFAGQQVNCPACQALCVIPSTQPQQPSAFPTVQQPAVQQPMVQQPMVQQPVVQQPMMQQPAPPPPMMSPPSSAFGPPGMAPAPQPDYQPAYGGRKTYKTGLGIFIFAIAACVFAGGFGFQRLAEAITELRYISNQATTKRTFESREELRRAQQAQIKSADTMRTLNNITSALVKIGAIALLLGIIAIVVASVFCIMSPSPLMALGITEVCVAAVAGILLSIYEIIPTLQDRMYGLSGILNLFGIYSLSGDIAEKIIGLMVRFTEIGTFLIFSIFMIYALRGKNRRGVFPEQPKISLITFSICAGIHLFLMILLLIDLRGEWVPYFYMFIRWLAHAAMIVGLVFIIKTCFEARAVYRV